MKTHKYIFLLFFLLGIGKLYGQVPQKGKIIDSETKQPVEGAVIISRDSIVHGYTDKDGNFEIKSLDSDSVRVHCFGYRAKGIKVCDCQGTLNLDPEVLSFDEVIINSFNTHRKLLETSAGIGVLQKRDLERGSNVSLQQAMNTIPGVQMDQSHLGEARISIRGVGVRSTFGIRNLKIYLNDIPLTEANGFTRIEGLDVSTLGSMEIMKGPVSSLYGAGLGGVIRIRTEKADSNVRVVDVNAMAGSFGLYKYGASLKVGSPKAHLYASLGTQSYEGYRAHSKDDRKFFTAFGQFYPSEKLTVSLFVNHSEQRTQLPGALDSVQFAESPRMASNSELSKNAGRNQNWTRIGVSGTYSFDKNFSMSASLYNSFYSLDHPLAFAYIRGTYQSYGGRSNLEYTGRWGFIKSRITLGGEYVNGLNLSKYYVNNNGIEGALTQDKEVTGIQYSIFAQAELEFPGKWIATLGLSDNSMSYKIKDLRKSNGVDFSGTKKFNPVLSPRIALAKVFNDKFSIYSSVSLGFSPPTDSEISNPDGSINYEVQPEKGINYEIGSRGDLLNKKLSYGISVFSMHLDNELIPQTIAPYQVVFVNAGKTVHNGVEINLAYTHKTNYFVRLIKPFIAYSYNDFYFSEYSVDGMDFSGKELTGISPHVFNGGIDLELKPGIYWYSSAQFVDQFPILDNNSVYNNAYWVVNQKIGFRKTILKRIPIDVYAGINNVLDEKYSSYVSLNAKASGSHPRFYNPSPGRNYYSGISVKYLF